MFFMCYLVLLSQQIYQGKIITMYIHTQPIREQAGGSHTSQANSGMNVLNSHTYIPPSLYVFPSCYVTHDIIAVI